MKKSVFLLSLLGSWAAWAQTGVGYMTLEEYLKSTGAKPQPRAAAVAPAPAPASAAGLVRAAPQGAVAASVSSPAAGLAASSAPATPAAAASGLVHSQPPGTATPVAPATAVRPLVRSAPVPEASVLPPAAPVAAPVAPAMASGIAQPQAVPPSVFEARRGDTLRSTLQRWSEQAGWQPLAWLLEADADYELQASATFGGDFVTSVQALVDALGSQVPLRVQFHHGNRLLVVEPLK